MLDVLKEGNKRFVNNEPIDKNYFEERDQLKNGQNPYAVIVTCSDARIPVGHIFDESFGKFFVIRTAGNIIDKIELASIEFAVSKLKTSLLLILGHRHCGAIEAALEEEIDKTSYLYEIVKKVKPAVISAQTKFHNHDEILEEAIRQNVINQIEYITQNSAIISELVSKNKLKIVMGIYEIESGFVDFIE